MYYEMFYYDISGLKMIINADIRIPVRILPQCVRCKNHHDLMHISDIFLSATYNMYNWNRQHLDSELSLSTLK